MRVSMGSCVQLGRVGPLGGSQVASNRFMWRITGAVAHMSPSFRACTSSSRHALRLLCYVMESRVRSACLGETLCPQPSQASAHSVRGCQGARTQACL